MEPTNPQADLEQRTKNFALAIIAFATKLPRNLPADVMIRQLLRSGTAIGANYWEANRAESHDDFIHKIAIIEKEASETQYWLELLHESNIAPASQLTDLRRESRELLAIFTAIGKTAKRNRAEKLRQAKTNKTIS